MSYIAISGFFGFILRILVITVVFNGIMILLFRKSEVFKNITDIVMKHLKKGKA
jgi:hypothetical protein